VVKWVVMSWPTGSPIGTVWAKTAAGALAAAREKWFGGTLAVCRWRGE
jgi:hypothetical protein